ncbi:MAG: hypothetical protein IIA02_00585 [Proteobacteria bacterium]|uniref:hypothetical protein n=1 Tax=Aquabacterium sp. TaxID=1872578 RepID=UPI0035C78113|nr:hypothetical protein [Pseudomonadota bacterium]
MFDALKRMISGPAAANGDTGQVLGAWAKAEGHAFKRVKDRTGGGFVVEANEGWRVEWGESQRPYIMGKELRFRCDTGMPHDVQMVMVSKTLAQALESDVFSRFTNAMQTQIDNSLPDEMRWLAMHPRVSLQASPTLAKRFMLLSNAEAVAKAWLDAGVLSALDDAAAVWWTDTLVLVLTLNRGILTMRTAGQPLEPARLKLVGQLFARLAARLREQARDSQA